jgi:transcriptional regulator with XRE-family HTH domain
MKEPFRLRISEQDRLERDPRHQRARIKRDNKQISEQIQRRQFIERTKSLQESRVEASLARGIKNYREQKGLTRGEMAEIIGITRRALFNYEEGKRSVPGELLENLVKRGDADLHEYFAVPSEPANNDQRKAEAQLAIALFRKCKEEFPLAEEAHLQDLAIDRAVRWQQNLKATSRNIEKMAREAVDELKDYYHEEAMREEFFNVERSK